jgi:2-oxoglutarate ferredoxin oxidoreductase subunit alpha
VAVHERDRPARNDLSTLPDFPAEIRAPAGSLPGVSGFQLHSPTTTFLTPGDAPDVLVAMNPAAEDEPARPAQGRTDRQRDVTTGIRQGGLRGEPARGRSLTEFHVHEVPLTTLTLEALKDADVTKARRSAPRTCSPWA